MPRTRQVAQAAWRYLKSVAVGLRTAWTRLQNILAGNYTRHIDEDRTHWISPDVIEYCSLYEFNIEDFKGRVLGGDWDRLEKRFGDLDIVVAFQDVLRGRCAWEDTTFFRRIAGDLETGRFHWGCRTREELSARCRALESLMETIRTTGYKSQAQLVSGKSSMRPTNLDDEITVSIGRRGHVLFSNSAHRLCIAKLLALDFVPVKVAVRHPEWVRHVKKSRAPEVIGGEPC